MIRDVPAPTCRLPRSSAATLLLAPHSDEMTDGPFEIEYRPSGNQARLPIQLHIGRDGASRRAPVRLSHWNFRPMHNMRASLESWLESPAAARNVQEQLRDSVVQEDRFETIKFVAGLDAHYAPKWRLTWAAAVLTRPCLDLRESALACRLMGFPYIPGLLSFREASAMLARIDVLTTKPDLLLIDGQGLAHPRLFRLACHVGVLADIPAIGVAKSRLIGTFEKPGTERGSWSHLVDNGRALSGTRRAARPVLVSIGHRVSLHTAVKFVLELAPRYRLPEPIRLADRFSRMHP